MRPWTWVSSALAPVALVGGWTLAQSRQPDDYDATRDTISALAAHGATDPWIMTVGLAGLGVAHLATAAGFTEVGRAGRLLLALGGAATVVVAASPQPAAAHVPAAGIAFVALALWPAPAAPPLRRLGIAASVGLSGVLIWFATELGGGRLLGLSERVVAAAEAVVPIVVLVARHRADRARRLR